MALPKFIITMDGHFRMGMVNQHKELLKPGDQCIGGGYYTLDFILRFLRSANQARLVCSHLTKTFDYVSNRIVLDIQKINSYIQAIKSNGVLKQLHDKYTTPRFSTGFDFYLR